MVGVSVAKCVWRKQTRAVSDPAWAEDREDPALPLPCERGTLAHAGPVCSAGSPLPGRQVAPLHAALLALSRCPGPRWRPAALPLFSSRGVFIRPPQWSDTWVISACSCHLLFPGLGMRFPFFTFFRRSVGHFGVFAVETVGFCGRPPEHVGSVPRSRRIPGRPTVHVLGWSVLVPPSDDRDGRLSWAFGNPRHPRPPALPGLRPPGLGAAGPFCRGHPGCCPLLSSLHTLFSVLRP